MRRESGCSEGTREAGPDNEGLFLQNLIRYSKRLYFLLIDCCFKCYKMYDSYITGIDTTTLD